MKLRIEFQVQLYIDANTSVDPRNIIPEQAKENLSNHLRHLTIPKDCKMDRYEVIAKSLWVE